MGKEGRQIMEWGSVRELETERNDPSKETWRDGGGEGQEVRDEAGTKHLTIHHSNLSKLLERRQALRGTRSKIFPQIKEWEEGKKRVEYSLVWAKGLADQGKGKEVEQDKQRWEITEILVSEGDKRQTKEGSKDSK